MSIDILQEKIRMYKNPTVVGLDPTPDLVPQYLFEEAKMAAGLGPEAAALAYENFCKGILDSLKDLVPAVKVQTACFFGLGGAGISAMQRVMAYAKELGYYVILDCMRGDMPETAEVLARGVFGTVEICGESFSPYACDAVTLNGYLGGDSIRPFLPYCRTGDKSIFVLVKTSNRSSVEVQDLLSGGRVVHTAMADLVNRWGADCKGKNGYSQVAAVVGATYPEVIKSLREKYDRMFFLVPGYGAQGGSGKSVQYAFDRFGHGAAVCASRSILGAWQRGKSDGRDFKERAREAAERMFRNIEKYCMIM